MTRREMIKVLVESMITDWVYCGMTDMIEDFLVTYDWKALNRCTNEELRNEVDDIREQEIKEYLESYRERKIREKILWK